MLIIPNQRFTRGKTVYETGMKYDVSEAVALQMVRENKGKVLKGVAEPVVVVRTPKVSNRDPIVEID